MLRARQPLRVAVLAGALAALTGCGITDDFRQALNEFRGGEAHADASATTDTPAELTDEIAETDTVTPEAPADDGPAAEHLVLAAQKLLRQMSYDPGPLDGLPGRQTRQAIKAFQTDTGLTVDGAVTPALILALVDASVNGIVAAPVMTAEGEPAPRYSPGDTYIYSDSTMATVMRVDGDVVVWQSGTGERGATHWNFIRPGATSPFDRTRVRYDVDAAADEIWPLQPGRSISFSARPVIAQASVAAEVPSTTQTWQCSVAGAEPVTVAAGRFGAVRISCQTSTPVAGAPVERTWFYAPELRHYVRLDERFAASQPVESVELVAIRLEGVDWPPAARAGLQRALQAALETAPKGERIEWKSSAVETRVTISPTAARQDASSYCRTFVQKVRQPDGQIRTYPGLACREASGQWVIPGATPAEAPS